MKHVSWLLMITCLDHAWIPGFRRLTRDSWVSVVSLEITGIVVSLEIPVFRILLVKNFGKIVKIVFSDSRAQNRILKCLWIFNMAGISYINLHFRAPSDIKHFNSTPRYQNLPGEPLTAHSDHQGPLSDPMYPPRWCFFDHVSPFLTFVRLIWPYLKWA